MNRIVRIEKLENAIEVISPFHPQMPPRAKNLGGKWNPVSNSWVFDKRDEERVRTLCKEIYGDDGKTDISYVDLLVKLPDGIFSYGDEYRVAGRLVARVFGRDSGAKLGTGVVVLKGGFGSGGSRKNFATTASKGTEFELRDVPIGLAEKAVSKDINISIIVKDKTDSAKELRIQALKFEKEKLTSRLLEVEKELSKESLEKENIDENSGTKDSLGSD